MKNRPILRSVLCVLLSVLFLQPAAVSAESLWNDFISGSAQLSAQSYSIGKDAFTVEPINLEGTDLEDFRDAYEYQVIRRAGELYRNAVRGTTIDLLIQLDERNRDSYIRDREYLQSEYGASPVNAGSALDYTSMLTSGLIGLLSDGAFGLLVELDSGLAGKFVDAAEEQFGQILRDVRHALNLRQLSKDDFVCSEAVYGEKMFRTDDLKELMLKAKSNGGKFTAFEDAVSFITAYQRNRIASRSMQLAHDYRTELGNRGIPELVVDITEDVLLGAMSGVLNTVFMSGNLVTGFFSSRTVNDFFSAMDFVATEFRDSLVQDWKNDLWAMEAETIWLFRYDYGEADEFIRFKRETAGWVHHWRMERNPRNTITFTRNPDGTLHMVLHFQGVKDRQYDIDMEYYRNVSGTAFFGNVILDELCGSMKLDLSGTPQLNVALHWMKEDQRPDRVIDPYISDQPDDPWLAYRIADNPDDGFARHWQMSGHPENTMDITRKKDGTFHLAAHFEGAGDYEFDLNLEDYRDQEGIASFGEIYTDNKLHGEIHLDLNEDGRMNVILTYLADIHEDHPLYPYITTDNNNIRWLPYVASDYRYELLPDGTAEITEYLGGDTDVYVPAELDGYPVTRIGSRAFYMQEKIETVWMRDVPATVIETEAFRGCKKLRFIDLPETLEEIGYKAFDYCISLTDIVLPDRIRVVSFQAFSFCEKLEEVYCPKSLRYIDMEAFVFCPKVWFYVYPQTHAEHWCCIHEYTWKGPVGEVRSRSAVRQEIDDATGAACASGDFSAVWAHRWVSKTCPELVLDITSTGDGNMRAVLSRNGESLLSFRMYLESNDNMVSLIETDNPDDAYHFNLYLEATKGYMAELYLDDELFERLFPDQSIGYEDLMYFYADDLPDPLMYGFDRYWWGSDFDGHWVAQKDGHTADLYVATSTMTPEGTSARLVMDGKETFDLISVEEIDPYYATFTFSSFECDLEIGTEYISLNVTRPAIGHFDMTSAAKFRYAGPCRDEEAGMPPD